MLRALRTSSLLHYSLAFGAVAVGLLLFAWPGLRENLFAAVAAVVIALTLPLLVPCALGFVKAAKLAEERRAALGEKDRELAALQDQIREFDLRSVQRAREVLRRALASPSLDLEALAGELAARERELQRALESLRVSNQTLNAIIQASPLAVMTLDSEGVVRMWNPAAERVYGWRTAEIVGQELPTVPPELRDEMHRNHAAAVRGRILTNLETVRLRKDGSRFHASISTAPLLDAEGRTTGDIVALVADVTQRKIAEESLRLSEERYRALVRATAQVVWTADERGQGGDARAWWEQLTGRTAAAAQDPWGWLEDVHPDDREPARRAWEQSLADRTQFDTEYRVRTRGGEYRHFAVRGVPLLNEDGSFREWVGTITDITQSRRIERALAESEERYRAFVEQSAEPIWRFEFDPPVSINLDEEEQIDEIFRRGHLAECNDVMARAYGYARAQDIVGKRLTEFVPPTATNVEYVRACIRSGYRVSDVESEELDRDGRPVYFLNNLVCIIEGGRLLRAWGTQRDITERRRREESQRFLSDAATLLASSLDYEQTLERVARLSVPYLADYCLVDMLDDEGALRRVTVAHSDPARAEAWREMQRRFPINLDSDAPVPVVLRTGRPVWRAEVTEAELERMSFPPEQIEMLKQLGHRSVISAPLVARGRTTGALTFVTAESNRRYAESDLALAADLAQRAAQSIDNARLYLRAQAANRDKDEFLATISHELRTPLTPVIGWLHMLRGGALTPEDSGRGLSVIEKNAQALARLINDLLD
ncbi:MAG: PAS domain S-box protein, partial [Pyrinomonadaceae bacterium]